MIRVKGSKTEKFFNIPSHLYKYSNNKLGLYLKDHKNYWAILSKLLDTDIDMSDDEVLFIFPSEMFPEISSIIHFVKKRGNGISPNLIKARKKTYFKHGLKIQKIKPILKEKQFNNIIALDNFNGGKNE